MGKIIKISGPLIVADGMKDVKMYDVVRVSDKGLIGEVIELRGDLASVQVYEETSMLGTGEPVVSTEQPLSVELAPGLIGGIYDGIQRPLQSLHFELDGIFRLGFGRIYANGNDIAVLANHKIHAAAEFIKRVRRRRSIYAFG